MLTLTQRIALNLRLRHRIPLSAWKGNHKRHGTVGLRYHLEGKCPCDRQPGTMVRLDYHGPGGRDEHPYDYLSECPAKHHDPVLSELIGYVIEIEEQGGLHPYSGRPLALLPCRTVDLYLRVLSARDRFLQERDAAQARLTQ